MKEFIAIIGTSKSGKSTVIQSLTGCATRSFQGFVRDKASRKEIFVVCGSPQETNLSLYELRRIVRRVLRKKSAIALVIALQPTNPSRRVPMEDVFKTVDAVGGFRQTAWVLDPPYERTKRALILAF